MLSPAPAYVPCWYAVHTRSNHEKAVAQSLLARGIDCFLPTYETVSRWKDRRMLLERPLFPGYAFVHISAAEKMSVLTVSGVLQVLCSRPVHDALCESLIEALRQEWSMHHVEACDYLPIGKDVTIVGGSFAGMRGVLLQHKKPNRVVISVAAIMCSFSIEVGLDEVRCTTGMLTEAFA